MLAEKRNLVELPVESSLQVKLNYADVNFIADVQFHLIPAEVSIKCSCCGRTTRRILEAFELVLPNEDSKINVLQEVEKVLNHTETCSATHVSCITNVVIMTIREINSEIDIIESEVAFDIERKLQDIFNGLFICDGCLMPELVEKKFQA